VTYGLSAQADWVATELAQGAGGTRFAVRRAGETLGHVKLPIPGRHNVVNALAALAVANAVEVPFAVAAEALASFRGVERRFETKGVAAGVRVVDDYGHHPTEVEATIAAAREGGAGRVVILFQPHLFSRTRHLAREFGVALAAADAVCVTEIYAAREEPVAGVSGKLVADAVAERRPGMPVAWAPRLEDAARLAAGWARAGDVVVTVGAGDVDRAVPAILEALR
jgi:UDP-N-acetylmuramate--alanine ligase